MSKSSKGATNLQVLLESKQEYTRQFINLTKPLFIQGLISLYKTVKDNNKQHKYILKEFQASLRLIPQWSQQIIENEETRFKFVTQCSWLEDLMKAVYVVNVQILSHIANQKKAKVGKMNVEVPSLKTFIHKCYISLARELWKQPFLVYHKVSKVDYQKNMADLDGIVSHVIQEAFRQSLPYKEVLNTFLGGAAADKPEANDDSDEESSEEEDGSDDEDDSDDESGSDEDSEEDTDEDSEDGSDDEDEDSDDNCEDEDDSEDDEDDDSGSEEEDSDEGSEEDSDEDDDSPSDEASDDDSGSEDEDDDDEDDDDAELSGSVSNSASEVSNKDQDSDAKDVEEPNKPVQEVAVATTVEEEIVTDKDGREMVIETVAAHPTIDVAAFEKVIEEACGNESVLQDLKEALIQDIPVDPHMVAAPSLDSTPETSPEKEVQPVVAAESNTLKIIRLGNDAADATPTSEVEDDARSEAAFSTISNDPSVKSVVINSTQKSSRLLRMEPPVQEEDDEQPMVSAAESDGADSDAMIPRIPVDKTAHTLEKIRKYTGIELTPEQYRKNKKKLKKLLLGSRISP